MKKQLFFQSSSLQEINRMNLLYFCKNKKVGNMAFLPPNLRKIEPGTHFKSSFLADIAPHWERSAPF